MHRSEQRHHPFLHWLAVWLLIVVLSLALLGRAGLSARAAPQAKPLIVCPDPIIAQWTFSNVSTPSAGSGYFIAGSGIGGPTYPPSDPSSDSPSISFNKWNSPTRDNADFLEFAVDTTEKIKASFKYSSSNSGPTTLELYYSTDEGNNFTQFGNSIGLTNSPSGSTNFYDLVFDLSSIVELNNASNVKFRLYAYGASAWNGTLKIDNVTFSGYCPPPPLSILISEIAWAGTAANTDHEWIELRNPGETPVDVTGWSLQAVDGNPNIPLSGTIFPGGYLLLERNEDAVADIAADIIYSFHNTLANSGETLILYDAASSIIDVANLDGGAWPAGNSSMHATMERIGELADSDSAWFTNNGAMKNGLDADGNLLWGTPMDLNSSTPTTTPTITLTPLYTNTPPAGQALSIVINEIAWAGTQASSDDEWIELYNPTNQAIDLTNWNLISSDGTPNIKSDFKNIILGPNQYLLLERTDDNATDVKAEVIYSGSLSNTGETLRLYNPNGALIDSANGDGEEWPAGNSSTYSTMQRSVVASDSNRVWVTYDGTKDSGFIARDNKGNDIKGTPGRGNVPINVTATPTSAGTAISTTVTPSRTTTAIPGKALSIIINEVAWAGTKASSDDEWIELYNPTTKDISLKGWKLQSSESNPSPNIAFKEITIKANGYLLLERSDDDATDVPADIIYSGSLSNTGKSLRLFDANGTLIDSANGNGGAWPAGIASTYSSMQRSLVAEDSDRVWVTYEASKDSGARARDAGGNEIMGTPGRANRPINVTATSTPVGGTAQAAANTTPVPQLPPILGISEFLPRPGYDWNKDGAVNALDEFVEIINAGQIDVNLNAYQLDDEEGRGSAPYPLPKMTLQPGERAVFFAAQSGLLLSDAGDTVRLLKGQSVVDAYTYPAARAPDLSWCRLPDRMGSWNAPCFPTPNNINTLTGTLPQRTGALAGSQPPACLLPDTAPPPFLFAECQAGGMGIWNRQHWDQADAPGRLRLDVELKWEAIVE